jgi:hypothetical protein
MSDTHAPSAPPPSTPTPQQAPPAPPPQTDVPVNEAPTNTQTPIGSQAPPKPPAVARQEAVEKAFARAREAQEEAKKNAPARERPGMGHNNPPEATAKEKAAPEKIADKTERTGQPSEAQKRYREAGKFARDPAKPETQPAAAARATPGQQQLPLEPGQQAQPAKPPIKPLDERAPYREAPGRFRDQAKAEWHATPESVRGGVYQMAREFQGAYEKYKADHGVMEELRPYHDLATKQGTSLRKAFDNYYGIEQKIRQDWVGGIDIVVQNVARANGWKRADGGPITVQDFAHHVLSMTPEQHQMSRQQNSQTSAEMQIGQLHQKLEKQEQTLNQMVYQQRFAGTRAEVDRFAEQHPRFDELADQIKIELDLGFPLEQAYARADKLRPSSAPQAAQTRTPTAQTRKTSISGAPDGGNGRNPANTRPSAGQRRNGEAKHPTIQEALERSMRRVGNGV